MMKWFNLLLIADSDPAATGWVICFGFIVVVVICGIASFKKAMELQERLGKMTQEQKDEYFAQERMKAVIAQHGELNSKMVCPHCQTTGTVRTKPIKHKEGISGAKATGALLTGGVSLLATGLSRKENRTKANCDHCGSTWLF